MISGINPAFSSDGEWCLSCDMGAFDLVVLQSDQLTLLQFCQGQLQSYFNTPLSIIRFEDARTLDWRFQVVELPVICCNEAQA